MEHHVLGIAEARASLPAIVERLATSGSGRVVLGSHRKPEAMIVPFTEAAAAPSAEPLLDRIRDRAELIKRIASLSRISTVSVFGSVARGEERDASDIDFLVDVAPGASLFDLARFELDMELLFDRPVDVVERAALDPTRDHAMIADAVAL